ncbi:unnamed protein product [Acanthoscelides obtectus]|uniref:Uncharacterized protein n=1 Tax=Acanthoscelides obtectus TaxID=200917 RepID=A0A9P0JUX5_ACAOB|nr:unnamed protein product [Acanthoscelides obtectus]CAK1641106.1 hypothetical protein AOBTE_LOCUS12157 [Acanthoscelides obtectus]
MGKKHCMASAIIALSMSEMLFHKSLWDSRLCRVSGTRCSKCHGHVGLAKMKCYR